MTMILMYTCDAPGCGKKWTSTERAPDLKYHGNAHWLGGHLEFGACCGEHLKPAMLTMLDRALPSLGKGEKVQRDALLALIQAARPLPWIADIDDPLTQWGWTGKFYVGYKGGTWCTYNEGMPGSEESARNLASLRLIEALPTLVGSYIEGAALKACLEAAHAEIDRLRGELDVLKAKGSVREVHG